VNAIAPGQIIESLPDISRFDPTYGDRYLARTPTKRLTSRAEVATLIAMLCTPEFDQVSGACIRIDGGAELPSF
jgi:NAD(P)-dependent dehydrogenase (short-subunit alcohol dehydrogenase family)